MPRARNIKPQFFTDGALSKLDIYARMLFAALWCLADREGRLVDCPEDIEVFAFPRDEVDTDALLDSLAPRFIERYEIEGRRYIQIANFKRHQNPHVNEKPSDIPPPPSAHSVTGTEEAPEQHHTSTVQTPEQHGDNPAGFLDSSLLDSSLPDSQEIRTAGGGNAHAREDLPVDFPPGSGAAYCRDNLRFMTSGNYEELRSLMEDGITDELVCLAVDEAGANGGRTWGYVRRILDRWIASGIRTAGDVKADRERFEKQHGSRGHPPGKPPANGNIFADMLRKELDDESRRDTGGHDDS